MPRFHMSQLRPSIPSQTLGRWGARLVLLTLAMLAGGLLIGFVRMTWTEHQLNQESEQQIAVNQAQKQRNDALKGEAEYRESDVYAEQAAREQLGMARDGETVLLPTVVLPPTPVPTQQPTPGAVQALALETEETPNYQRWWRALFPGPDAKP